MPTLEMKVFQMWREKERKENYYYKRKLDKLFI